MSDQPRAIQTPDRRVRVFVSSTLEELAEERRAARAAITRLRLTPVMFELGARPHPPRELYRAYLAQSEVFVGIYWQRYGWVAHGETISGLEDEYRLAGDRPKLIYVKAPAPERDAGLDELLDDIRDDDNASYKSFSQPAELEELLSDDLAVLLTERFTTVPASPPDLRVARPPVPPTPIVGRQADVDALCALLRRPDVRLITVVGPGGIGKTRLALEIIASVAVDFDGAWFVELASVSDPALVPATIAAALGVHSEGARVVLDVLVDRLAARRVLLVLDNFEHLLPAAPDLARLLATCQGVSVLVTSRAALRLRGEHEFPLAPLAIPPAVQLFVARAQDVRPAFTLTPENEATVAEICRRLDGIPLAIELAAARVRLLNPPALLQRLGDRLDLHADQVDLPERQRTLRATVDWSHSLLDDSERALFARLSVFASGCTLEAAEAVGSVDGDLDVLAVLSSLVAHSLVATEERQGTEPRFRMLDTVREYAQGRLRERGEDEATVRRFTDYLRRFSQQAGMALDGPENRLWTARIDAELGNLRAGLRWAIAADEAETAVRVAAPLTTYWWARALLAQMLDFAEETAALPSAARLPADAACVLLWSRGAIRLALGELDQARPLLREVVGRAREVGDERLLAHTLYSLALTLPYDQQAAEMRALFEEALAIFRRLDDAWGVAFVLSPLGQLALRAGDVATAIAMHTESLANAERVDNDHMRGQALNQLGLDALLSGDVPGARARFEASAEVHRGLLYQEGLAYCLDGLAGVAFAQGLPGPAARLLGAAARTRDSAGVAVWPLLRPLADAARAAVEQALGAQEFHREWDIGAALRADEALTYGLQVTATP